MKQGRFDRCEHCLRAEWTGGPCPRCKYDGRPRNAPPLLPEGTRIGSHFVLGLAEGKGGFSVCYRAWDCQAEELIAIKELFPTRVAARRRDGSIGIDTMYQTDFQAAADALIQEAEVLTQLQGLPAIVRVRDVFEDNGTVYMAMEHLRGESYEKYLEVEYNKHGEEVSPRAAVNVVFVVLGALQAVHAKGLLHLDIKPSNVRIRDNGTVVLLDFGSARDALRQRSYRGTYTHGFAAPEQYYSDREVTAATDVYAVGALLYYSLCRTIPTAANDREKGAPLPTASSLNPSVLPALEAVITKAMSLDPAQRYASVGALRQALQNVRLPHEKHEEPRRPGGYPTTGRRVMAGAIDLSLAGVLLVAAALAGFPQALASFIILWALLQLLPMFIGATPGMFAVGLKLEPVDKEEAVDFLRVFYRATMLVPAVVTGFRADNQGLMLHDRASGTRPVLKPA